jgi:outer membrane receptor protein involved in Fe transport
MNTFSKLKSGVAPAALGLALLATPAFAQDAAPQADASADADAGQQIIVTGSRIANPNLESAVPVAVVSSAKVESTGATNIADILNTLPAAGQGISRSSSNFSSTGNAVATVNLRNLGSARTLVLINGRRTVGLPGSSAVDLNNVPTELIDRVEVVTGGASAVYGSEAIAGVVNFVLKRNFSGLEMHGQATVSGKGDAPRQYISALAGYNFADDRGNITLNASFDSDKGLRSRNRSFSAHDIPNRSSYAAQGLFSVANPDQAAFSAANGLTYTFNTANQLKGYQGANIDGYDRNQQRYLALPVDRYTVGALGHYDAGFGDFYFEGTYVKTKSSASLEAAAIDNVSPGGRVLNFDGSDYAGIPISSPFVPAAIRAAAIANGVDVLQFRRRSVDIFSRSNKNDRDFWRGVVGVKGDINPSFTYDVYYEHSQTRDHTSAGAIFAPNYGAALSNQLDASGNVVCSDPAARAAGCVPINIFGYNTVSSAAATWLQTDPGPAAGGLVKGNKITFDYLAKNYQDVAAATVTGKLFSLFGSEPINVAAGFEYRSERSSETFDPYTQAGLASGNQLSNTVGRFNVKEGFGEIVAPILQDRPGVHYLGLEAAVRYADYSTTGGVWSYKFGGAYAPSADLRIRAIYSRATRAPNIGELFSAASQTFPAINDPCDQGQGNGDGATLVALPAICAQIPGISATVASRGSFAYSTAQLQTVDGLLGGNRNLQTEKADTLTIGAIVTPTFIPRLQISVDYYKIKVLNAISTVGQQVSVSECVNSGNPLFCNNVIRNSAGFITRVNDLLLNTASIKAEGIDTELHYNVPFNMLNAEYKFGVDAFWSHKLKQERTPYPGGTVQNEIGQADCYSCGRLGSGFRDKVDATFTLATEGTKIVYNVTYLSPLSDNLDGSTAVITKIPAYWYHNAQVRFDIGPNKRQEFYLGVNNMFDKKPPQFGDTNPVTFPGTQTVATTYDLYGRMFYAGVTFKF